MNIYVVVNFLSHKIFVFLLFLGTMYMKFKQKKKENYLR